MLLEGRFTSAFAGDESPLLAEEDASGEAGDGAGQAAGSEEENASTPTVTGVIERSPGSARLVVIGSNDFTEDTALQFAGAGQGRQVTGQLDFVANLAEWSLDDSGLMQIRSGSQFNRTLPTLSEGQQRGYEYSTYAAALVLLAVLIVIQRWRRRQRLQQLTQWA